MESCLTGNGPSRMCIQKWAAPGTPRLVVIQQLLTAGQLTR
jgi:hypothetical protein